MKFLKNKYILPAALVGVLLGYTISDKVLPHYLPSHVDGPTLKYDVLTALGQQPTYYRQTPSGNYLAAKFAQNKKDWDKAYEYMGRVLRQAGDNPDLEKHTMVLAMAYGNIEKAQNLAQSVLTYEPNNLLAALFITMKHFEQENYKDALETLESLEDISAVTFLVPVLKLWAQSELGQVDITDLPASSFYAYHALLIHHYIKPDPALLNYAITSYDLTDVDLRDIEKFANILALSGKESNALKLYRKIETTGFGTDILAKKITTLEDNQPINSLLEPSDIENGKEGAALVLNNMASILFKEYSDDSATIFARMSHRLNLNLDTNLIIIASILSRNERYDEAIKMLDQIKPDSANNVLAQRSIAQLYAEQDRNEAAIQKLIDLYNETDELETLVQAGDLYRLDENYQKASELYSQVIDKVEQNTTLIDEDFWHVFYARGMAYERLKDFERAEKDLLLALKFQPDDPYILNYLGYSWADQGMNLDKSLDMISRAVQAKPDDGYIADSLGWVLYKMNQFDAAIPPLERAVELMPYDATLNDHLGDAYWQVGRQNEAKFQWQRALNYSEDNEVELKTSIADKLVSGIKTIDKKPKSVISHTITDEHGV